MGSIHINRNRQNLGQYSDQDVADGLQSGKFLPDDLAWQEPMESWQPLSAFTNLPPASEILPQPPPLFSVPPAFAESDAPVWESAAPPPLLTAALETIKQIFAKPVETFRAMPGIGGFGKPLKFYLLVSWATGAIALLYEMTAALINPQILASLNIRAVHQWEVVVAFFVVILILPAILFVRSFAISGVVHLALAMVGGATKPFETTFRVICYAMGATSVVQVVPICGTWLSIPISLVYCVVGLKEAHGTDLWRPILAIFLVSLVCCGGVFGFSALVVNLGYSAIGAAAK
jgi:hypothetical protein